MTDVQATTTPPFRRMLVANRGEIAVRIMATCRDMGIASVAVYSDADARARHTRTADIAVRIGPPAARDSYLSVPALLAAAAATGAEAVHPGYGFLSENADFAQACADAGLVFIGPTPDTITRMGSKINARVAADRAGVPVVPGATPAAQTVEAIADAAQHLGFPLLLKPSAGGGGIGMTTVRDASGLRAAIQTAQREALAAFGNGTLYVERLIEAPRHIEFQILGDHHGQVVHLFERECSLQRRHQKVLEESPSAALHPQLRARMGGAAVAIGREVGYRNAGTVEFLVEGTGADARFYFLEMNTRLQVEHAVTEQVTGLDLVRAQIMVASGARLPWPQEAITQRGHAMELRIYAEDPRKGDVPQAGPILLYREPSLPGVRVDSAIAEGDVVSVYYDPLLAKLIVTGEHREAARHRALSALRIFPILGIRTNIPLLVAVLEHPDVVAGEIDTGFLTREGPARRPRLDAPPSPEAVAVAVAHRAAARAASPGQPVAPDPWVSLRGCRV